MPLQAAESAAAREPAARRPAAKRPAAGRRRPPGRGRDWNLVLGAALCGLVAACALVGLFYSPHDPLAMDLPRRLLPPGPGHPLGTDQYGRDILSRLLRAAPAAVGCGAGATALGAALGVPLGLFAGFHRGWLDEAAMRLMDGLYAFPFILLALLVVTTLGPGLLNATLAIGLGGAPVFARLARAEALALRERQFVEAARASGARDATIVLRHLLPNALPTLAVQASLAFSGAVLAEAALSFLGLGVQPPHPSWGRMLEEAQSYLSLSPWPALFPGLAIALAVLGFNLLGDGLRDRL